MWSWWDCIRWWDIAWDGTMPWPMFLPMLLPIVMIAGVIVLVILLMRGGKAETLPPWRDARRQTSLEILSERFARGEIDRHEFEERKGLLSQR